MPPQGDKTHWFQCAWQLIIARWTISSCLRFEQILNCIQCPCLTQWMAQNSMQGRSNKAHSHLRYWSFVSWIKCVWQKNQQSNDKHYIFYLKSVFLKHLDSNIHSCISSHLEVTLTHNIISFLSVSRVQLLQNTDSQLLLLQEMTWPHPDTSLPSLAPSSTLSWL